MNVLKKNFLDTTRRRGNETVIQNVQLSLQHNIILLSRPLGKFCEHDDKQEVLEIRLHPYPYLRVIEVVSAERSATSADPIMAVNVVFGSKPTVDIEPKFVFGLTNNVSGNCLYWKNDLIVFPAMSVIVIYDVKNNHQKFIKLAGRPQRVITAMDLNAIKYVIQNMFLKGSPCGFRTTPESHLLGGFSGNII